MTTTNIPTTRTTASYHAERERQVAYVSMQDSGARSRIVALLEREGWAVIPQPTGFHLLSAIAGLIDGDEAWLRPSLIIIDAWARGCAGTTIATGLRELGISIPIVLIAAPGQRLPVSPDRTLRIVDSEAAEAAVAELVRPARATERPCDQGAVTSASRTENASRVTASR